VAGTALLFSLGGFIPALTGYSPDGRDRFYSLGMGLVFLSAAVVFAVPLVLNVARARRMLALAALGVVAVYMGACGSGLALIAANPLPTPPDVRAELSTVDGLPATAGSPAP
jgi:hypothetical protein